MSDIINQNTEPLFIFDMPDDEALGETISVKGEKGEKGDPTKLSELENDAGFITANTSALTNYYDKATADALLDDKLDEAAFDEYEIPNDFFTASKTISGSGSSISLANTAEAALDAITIYGDVAQSTTPTPESPVPVRTATGGQSIVFSSGSESKTYTLNLGKNLFDKDNDVLSANCYLAGSTTSTRITAITGSTLVGKCLIVKLQENETYTIQKLASARFRFGFTKSATPQIGVDGVITSRLANADTSAAVTFTVPVGSPYLVCNFYSNDQTLDAQNGYDAILNSIQIEKGTSASGYMSYISPIELYGIGDYRDSFVRDQSGAWYIDRKVAKYTFAGSDADYYNFSADATNTLAVNLVPLKVDKAVFRPNNASMAAFSDLFAYGASATDVEHIYLTNPTATTGGYYGNIRLYLSKTRLSSYDESMTNAEKAALVKTWLQSNPLTAYYILSTPTTEPITNAQIIEQLEALRLAKTFNGTTDINVNGILPVILSITAFKNGWGGTVSGLNADINRLDAEKANTSQLDGYYTKAETDALVSDPTNPIYYGADPTGVNDSATAINACIQANKGGAINFTNGTYLVNGAINLPFANDEKVSINGNGATIKTTATLDALIVAGYDRPSASSRNDVGYTSYIKDLKLDGEDGTVTYAIKNLTGFKDLKVINCRIFRFVNGVLIGDTTGSPADILVSECMIYGKGSEYDGTGIIANCTDNNINMCRIYGFRKGFVVNGYCIITRCHVLLRWAQQTSSNMNPYEVNSEEFNGYYEPTTFAELNADARILSSYCDSMYNYAKINTTGKITINTCFYYNARTNVNAHLFEISVGSPRITISDCSFALCKYDDCRVIVIIDTGYGYFGNSAQINLSNNLISGLDKLTAADDLILSDTSMPSAKFHNQMTLNANTWYVAKIISNVPADTVIAGALFMGGWPYDVIIKPSSGNIYQVNAGGADSDYAIGYVYIGTSVYICIKPSVSKAGLKIDFNMEHASYQSFSVTPVKGSDYNTSTRLLSDYTNEVPSIEKILKQTNYS